MSEMSVPLSGWISEEYGRVGVRVNHHSYVTHVYSHGPASGNLKEGDKILLADEHKGHSKVDGKAGELVTIKVKRGEKELTFVLTRVPKSQIYDKLPQQEPSPFLTNHILRLQDYEN